MSHIIKIKIYYEDTDCGGVIYYANYLRYLEHARTEYLESHGLSLKNMKDQGIQFVVRHVDITYLSPGHYGDILNIETDIEKAQGMRIIFANTIKNSQDHHVLARAKTTLICVNNTFKPIRIPNDVKAGLKT